MLHAREDYNRIQDPAGLIPENEPVFLLRGQDVFAPNLLRDWADKIEATETIDSMIMADMVRDHADLMKEWQKTVKVKIPDLP